MAFRRHFSGGPFEAKIAYCRAVETDGWIFVSGSTGTDPETGKMPESVVDQCRNTLATIGRALAEFGAGFEHVVRVHYILPDRNDFEPCWPVLQEVFGDAPPAATMFEAGLIADGMKIEIEVTARKP
ncbi:RidA family protein [Albimonas sp. CAU 1670]|uniref:RidA family protein n=1 Tax=Albimonas sp. CAU 1670 TaxID=3032599 RepID=UPI0023DB88E3|nr:RidA family protein [Albimonas sp. CAU 1670]MDF2234452.1 RidA family protein [Albimonas sp. CAU 1670]